MTRTLLAMTALALGACGGGASDVPDNRDASDAREASIESAGQTTVEQAPVASYAAAPSIGGMTITDQSFFCSFYGADVELDPEDPSSWEFLFLTVYDGSDLPADSLNGQALLDDELRKVELVTSSATETGERWEYRTTAPPMAVLALDLNTGEEGYESIQYTGSIQVTTPAGGSAIAIEGSCGS